MELVKIWLPPSQFTQKSGYLHLAAAWQTNRKFQTGPPCRLRLQSVSEFGALQPRNSTATHELLRQPPLLHTVGGSSGAHPSWTLVHVWQSDICHLPFQINASTSESRASRKATSGLALHLQICKVQEDSDSMSLSNSRQPVQRREWPSSSSSARAAKRPTASSCKLKRHVALAPMTVVRSFWPRAPERTACETDIFTE